MHQYTDHEINNIISITKNYEAKEYITPTSYITLAISMYLGGLCLLYKSSFSSSIIFKCTSIILMSFIVVRNFMIFHDLGHCNYFPTNERKTDKMGINTYLCELLDFMFFFPGKSWRLGHKKHHKVHGNISEYDQGRTITWTTHDYNNASQLYKVLYDTIRHPFIFFTIAPIYIFVLQHVIDLNYIYFTKLGLMLYLIYNTLGSNTFFLLLKSLYLSSVIGLILFHWQHSINEPYWKNFDLKNDKNSKMNAELNGSSVLRIPEIFKLFTNGIEYHNVHHVNPAVPSYNIRNCYEELREKGLLKNREIYGYELWEALGYTIYDNESNKYVNHYKKYKL